MLEVPRPWWRWTPPSNPGVAALSILVIFFTPLDDFLIGPAIGAKGIAVKTPCLLLVVLAAKGLGVQRDDRDLVPAIGAVAVGRKGEDSNLIFGLRM